MRKNQQAIRLLRAKFFRRQFLKQSHLSTKRINNASRRKFAIYGSLVVFFWSLSLASSLSAQSVVSSPQVSADLPMASAAKSALAHTFAKLIEQAVPLEYDRKKDWGKTKNITVGLRNEGLKLKRRKRAVKHGVWKHYKVKLIDPDEKLSVRIENLNSVDGSRARFTLVLNARISTWARAKVYQYGIHLIALEVLGDTDIELALDCEVGVQLHTGEGSPGLAIDPQVFDARLNLSNFRINRVSNAKGPLVHELSSGLRRAIEHELDGPKLVAKINRSIDKKRDRLELGLGDLLDSSWWPLASLPDIQTASQELR